MAANVAPDDATAEVASVDGARSLRDETTWGGSEKAARRFRKCEDVGETRGLNISKCDLSSLPAELGKLHTLKVISFFKNKLAALPTELGKMRALTCINCSFNSLTSLPAELGQLQALKFFNCTNNQLTSIPDAIWQIPTLQIVFCENNLFTHDAIKSIEDAEARLSVHPPAATARE